MCLARKARLFNVHHTVNAPLMLYLFCRIDDAQSFSAVTLPSSFLGKSVAADWACEVLDKPHVHAAKVKRVAALQNPNVFFAW